MLVLSKRQFALKCDTSNPQIQQQLAHIPGLTLEPNQVRGSYDAVCLAVKRLNMQQGMVLIYAQVNPKFGQRTARDYQKTGIIGISKRLNQFGGAILGDEMGLGKSFQAICASQTLAARQTVIVCPKKAKYTWRDEVLATCGEDVKIQIIKTGKDVVDETIQYIIVTYDLAHVVDEQAMPDFVILDEAHKLRGRSTQRFERIKHLVASARWKLALSGTPLWNKPKDTWGILNSILPYVFGQAGAFDLAYCDGKRNEWGGIENDGVSRADELKERLSLYTVRRLKEDVLAELPPIQYIPIWVDADAKALEASHYARINRTLGNIINAEKATLECKIEAACELAAEAKQFLLFTWMREHAERMCLTLQKEGTRCYYIHGGLSENKRHEICQAAIQEQCGIVATIDSLGESVNLQHLAKVGIFHTIDPNPQKTAQASDRLHRLGITHNVTWYFVGAKESIDEEIIATNLEKLDAANAVIGATRNTNSIAAAMQPQTDDAVLADLYKHME